MGFMANWPRRISDEHHQLVHKVVGDEVATVRCHCG